MQLVRGKVFETNSSSTHALTTGQAINKNYAPIGDTIKIEFINTDDCSVLSTLKEKVSYLVSHIISWYMYDADNYDDLIRQVKNNYDFIRIQQYVMDKFNKIIVFPEKYDGDIEEIVEINHQLTSWNHSLTEILEELVIEDRNLLDDVLLNGKYIEFGRD